MWEKSVHPKLTTHKKFTFQLQKHHCRKILQPHQIFHSQKFYKQHRTVKEYWETKKSNFIPNITWALQDNAQQIM